MQNRYLDGTVFLDALRETTEQLRLNREEINRINVFPVPDGDTGNNLVHTLEFALQEAEQAGDNRLSSVIRAASRGAQNGSCGSSGAIFAQFLVGWSLILCRIDRAGVDTLVKAMKEGTRKAYAAVLRPVEGTILTVARKAAEGAQKAAAKGGDIADTLCEGYRQAVKALNQTPGMLEALGCRSVIDAGGWGLLMFFSSLLKAMHIHPDGEEISHTPAASFAAGESDIFDCKDMYDLEFIIDHSGMITEEKIRGLLHNMGSQLITRPEPEYCHLHIHTDKPHDVIEKAASLAPLKKLIIRNMSSQFQNMQNPSAACGDAHVPIAVGKNPGFMALFALAGAEAVVNEDLPRKISQLAGEFRGKNPIIITAGKYNRSECDVPVVYLEDDARVLSALLMINTGQKATVESISRAAGLPRLARLARSADSFTFQVNGTVNPAKGGFRDVLVVAAASLEPQNGEVLALFYGAGMKRSMVERGAAAVQKLFPYLDIEVHFGGQEDPLILAVE